MIYRKALRVLYKFAAQTHNLNFYRTKPLKDHSVHYNVIYDINLQHRYSHPFLKSTKWLENWFQQSLNIINGASNMYDASRLFQNREIYKTALADLSLENEKNEWKCFLSRQCTNGLSLNISVALLFGLTVQERCDIAPSSKKTCTFYLPVA